MERSCIKDYILFGVLKMVAIDKIRKYVRSISKNEEHYNCLLDRIYINPKYRNEKCIHPEHETCENCSLNFFKR